MAWSTTHDSDTTTDCIHAVPVGGTVALCGDAVDSYGEPWPHPDLPSQSADARPVCKFCSHLMAEG